MRPDLDDRGVWNIGIAAGLEIGKRATVTPGGENFCNRRRGISQSTGYMGWMVKGGWFSEAVGREGWGTAAANISENGCGRDVDSVEIVLG
ncbi:hypothetical protein QLX08_005828 [Tetragonisca angustula]|uniref:Uncharacterized protein n=1 Tax=Tetragonisca angustula TaxID=166442 RepID=A0AAW0ZYY0_9HYME